MTIVIVAWARNEADILEAWIRHHAAIADSVHVVLHRTRDNSVEILKHLKNEGIAVTWSSDERATHDQSSVLTALLHERADAGCDWVLPLDLDEFLIGDVRRELRENNGRVLRIPWKGYVPMPSDPQEEKHVLRRIGYRRTAENPPWYKVCIPTSAVKRGCSLGRGNHALLDASGRPDETHDCALSLAHFPVRSVNQLKRKICCGLAADALSDGEDKGTSFHWKELHARLRSATLPTSLDLQRMAEDYASAKQWGRWQNERSVTDEAGISVVHDPVSTSASIKYDIVEADTDDVIRENDALFSGRTNAEAA